MMRVAVGSGETGRTEHKHTRDGRAQREQNGRFLGTCCCSMGREDCVAGDCCGDSGCDGDRGGLDFVDNEDDFTSVDGVAIETCKMT